MPDLSCLFFLLQPSQYWKHLSTKLWPWGTEMWECRILSHVMHFFDLLNNLFIKWSSMSQLSAQVVGSLAFSVCMDVSSQDTSTLWKKESFQQKCVTGGRTSKLSAAFLLKMKALHVVYCRKAYNALNLHLWETDFSMKLWTVVLPFRGIHLTSRAGTKAFWPTNAGNDRLYWQQCGKTLASTEGPSCT